MKATEPTPRDQVRSHKVSRAFGAVYETNETNKKTCYQAHETNKTQAQGRKATLTLAGDGILQFDYNVDLHTDYTFPPERGDSLQSEEMVFGHSGAGWQEILSAHPQIKDALTAAPGDRARLLNTVVKERLMLDLHKAGIHADLFLAEGSEENFTRWEQVAVCAAATITDLRLVSATGEDNGRGLFGLPDKFDHIEIAMLPSFDPVSLFRPKVATNWLWGGMRHCLMVYKNVKSEEELLELRNTIFAMVNRNKPIDFQYRDNRSKRNARGKFIRFFVENAFTPLMLPAGELPW